jgi:hypothetical protein
MIIYYEDGYWGVQSSHKKSIHLIFWSKGMMRWICDCKDFEYRRVQSGDNCKHIKMLLEFMSSASIEKLLEVMENGSTKL